MIADEELEIINYDFEILLHLNAYIDKFLGVAFRIPFSSFIIRHKQCNANMV